jgi:hypothetical protein
MGKYVLLVLQVIRYSHYALTTLKVCPAWLTYLRFYPLTVSIYTYSFPFIFDILPYLVSDCWLRTRKNGFAGYTQLANTKLCYFLK